MVDNKDKTLGEDIDKYYERIYKRTDLTPYVTHLTKPTVEQLNEIFKNKESIDENMLDQVNYRAVDRLIQILKEQKLIGSTTESGFIIGPRPAVCFQELPLKSIKENIDLQMQSLNIYDYKRLKYCGVGIRFDKFYIYEAGGRPVIYEEKNAAKELLGNNRQEFWRIVSFELDRQEPYIENLFGINAGPIIEHNLETRIIDWTHEREWRIPDNFNFNLVDDFRLNNHLTLIFKDRKTYNYFIKNYDKQDEYEYGKYVEIDFNDIKINVEPSCDDDYIESNYHIIILDELEEFHNRILLSS